MMNDSKTAELTRRTQSAAEHALHAEVAMLAHELRDELGALRDSAIAGSVSAIAALLGAQAMIDAAASSRPRWGVAIGALLLVVAAGALRVAATSTRRARATFARRERRFDPNLHT